MDHTNEQESQSMFNALSPTNEPMVMESFCVNCEKNGKTTILLTQIPFFREIIIVSFSCEECGYKNNEVQSGGKIQDMGSKVTLTLTRMEDLSRDVIKSEFALIRIPEIELEVPSSKKGCLNTIEGLLSNFYEELNTHQEIRRRTDTENAAKIDVFLSKLKDCSKGKSFPFTFIIDDPSGNSHIKNLFAPHIDPNLKIEDYERTQEQLIAMGFQVENSVMDQKTINPVNNHNAVDEKHTTLNTPHWVKTDEETKKDDIADKDHNKTVENEVKDHLKEDSNQIQAHRLDFNKPLVEDLKQESFGFTTTCHVCGGTAETKMCIIAIPYFKELIIMSSTCPKCGARSADTKTGGEVSKLGRTIHLKVENEDDLRRDCFKSETCELIIPEAELELANGTLGGRYTTIEGLLEEIEKNLKNNNPFFGDSADSLFKGKMTTFFDKMKSLRKLKSHFNIILKDPMANSFVQNPYYPDKDPRCEAFDYERSHDENEFLGLNDMKTDNY